MTVPRGEVRAARGVGGCTISAPHPELTLPSSPPRQIRSERRGPHLSLQGFKGCREDGASEPQSNGLPPPLDLATCPLRRSVRLAPHSLLRSRWRAATNMMHRHALAFPRVPRVKFGQCHTGPGVYERAGNGPSPKEAEWLDSERAMLTAVCELSLIV